MGDNEKTFDILESLHISLADRMQLMVLSNEYGLSFNPDTLKNPVRNLDVFKKEKNSYYFIQNGELLIFEHLDCKTSFLICKKNPNMVGESEIYYFIP